MRYKHKILFLIAALTILTLTGCNKIKNIKMTGCSIESVSPMGMRGLKAELAVGIENPAMQFEVSDIHGTVYYKDSDILYYTAEPISVKKHCAAVYPVICTGTAAKQVSMLYVFGLLKNSSVDDYTVDINVKLKLKGVSKDISIKKKPLKDFMED